MSHDHAVMEETHDPPTLQMPVLNCDDYRDELAEFGLTPEQEEEFLTLLWEIVRTAVDIGFGLDSAQVLIPALTKMAGPDSENGLEQKDTKNKQTHTERSQS